MVEQKLHLRKIIDDFASQKARLKKNITLALDNAYCLMLSLLDNDRNDKNVSLDVCLVFKLFSLCLFYFIHWSIT